MGIDEHRAPFGVYGLGFREAILSTRQHRTERESRILKDSLSIIPKDRKYLSVWGIVTQTIIMIPIMSQVHQQDCHEQHDDEL